MDIKNRNLFRLTRFILLKLPLFFKFFAKVRKPEKKVLIIKTDAIGDYIFFRNFIGIVKNAEQFQGCQIHLLGNRLWQDIALKYDRAVGDDFFFTKPDDLYEAPWQTLKLAWQLYKNNYEVVLQPTYARTFIGDSLAGFTAGKSIIGFTSDTERINIKYKTRTDKFYTQLLQLLPDIDFEFNRSTFFFENVLQQPVLITGPSIAIEDGPRQGVILSPGAGVFKRGWEREKFLELAKLIIQHSPHQIYIVGGPSELETGAFLMQNLPADRVTDLTGKTSLTELVELIGHAVLLIGNESSAIHIAAAVKTRAICILGGGHFGRFAPYPANVEHAPICLFEKMECYNCNWRCIFQTAADHPFPCVSIVSVEKVWGTASRLL